MPRKAKYDLLTKLGLCATCEVRKAEAGKTRCTACLKKRAEYTRRYLARKRESE